MKTDSLFSVVIYALQCCIKLMKLYLADAMLSKKEQDIIALLFHNRCSLHNDTRKGMNKLVEQNNVIIIAFLEIHKYGKIP
jgi:hypothetical protein